MEGGGDTADGKASLRQGMSSFLRSQRKHVSLKVVACGSRGNARDAFLNAMAQSPGTFNILLVDSEAPVSTPARLHLEKHDGWTLATVTDDKIHLMIQVMETWVIADAEAVAEYYRQGFLRRAILPDNQDLEVIDKLRVYAALDHATARTQKGAYRKIAHAAALLGRIHPEIVRQRCPSCDRLLATLERVIREP